jgi:hypothetical protein
VCSSNAKSSATTFLNYSRKQFTSAQLIVGAAENSTTSLSSKTLPPLSVYSALFYPDLPFFPPKIALIFSTGYFADHPE